MGDLCKIIVATGFENLPKVQQIAQFGHTGQDTLSHTHVPIPTQTHLHEQRVRECISAAAVSCKHKGLQPKGVGKSRNVCRQQI